MGIRDPRSVDPSSYFAFANVADRSFSTSGDYERFVLKAGKRYHHLLDPKTGYPATRSRSVTVMAKSAELAEIISKGLFVLGPEEGLALLQKFDGVEAVIVDHKNRVHVSRGLEQSITITRPPTDGP